MANPTPQQKAWLTRLRPVLPRYFPEARGQLDLRISGPPDLRTYSRLFPFTILEDGLPLTELVVKVPQGRKAADVHLAFRAHRLLETHLAEYPHLTVPRALDAWEDPPALIMLRVEGAPLYIRMRDCRSWAPENGCQLARHFVWQAGRWLGVLHQLTPPRWSRPAPNPLAQREHWLLALRAGGLDPMDEKRIRERTDVLAASAHESVPLHGDFTLRNVLCHPPQQVTVLDTELAFFGEPALDIGWFLAALRTIDKWQIMVGEMAYPRAVIHRTETAFLEGYQSVRTLPPQPLIQAYTTLRLLERWADFVQQEKQRNIAGLRVLVIRRINQHFARMLP